MSVFIWLLCPWEGFWNLNEDLKVDENEMDDQDTVDTLPVSPVNDTFYNGCGDHDDYDADDAYDDDRH